MSKKPIVVIASVVVALVLLSTGYGLWEKTLYIKGTLTVNRPLFTEQVIPKLSVADAVYPDSLLEIPMDTGLGGLLEEPGNSTGHDGQVPAGEENDQQSVTENVYREYP